MSVEVGNIAIFKNEDATPENRRPQFNIKFSLNGVDYEAGLWRRTTKTGAGMYSGKINQVNKLESVPNASMPKPPAASSDFTDDIPF
jgi:hypothetical protein